MHNRTVENHLKTKGCMKCIFMQPFSIVNHGMFYILAPARKTVCRVVTMTIDQLNQTLIENVSFDDSLIGTMDMSRSSAYELMS